MVGDADADADADIDTDADADTELDADTDLDADAGSRRIQVVADYRIRHCCRYRYDANLGALLFIYPQMFALCACCLIRQILWQSSKTRPFCPWGYV